MAKPPSRCLVIDASVIRAAGTRERGRSLLCRQFLMHVLEICHHVTLTPDIRQEWKRHHSRFSQKWLHQMFGHKKQCKVTPADVDSIRKQIADLPVTEKQADAMFKDLPLVAAAMASDRCVVSLDEEVRGLLHTAASRIPQLRSLVWVNPEHADEETPIAWLQKGAPKEHRRSLGAQTSQA